MTTKAYDDMVERIRAERFKPTKLTEAECKSEVEKVLDGAKSSFEGDYHGTGIIPLSEGYVTKSGRIMKSKPGRKKGSKNKPKTDAKT